MVADSAGDPRMAVLTRLHGADPIPDEGLLDWLGGERTVLEAASAWQADVGAVVVAEALTEEWESLADPDCAARALLAAVEEAPVPPGGFGDLLDALVDVPDLLARVGRDLFAVVLGTATNDATSPLRAGVALEAAARLALGGYGNRYRLLAALTEPLRPEPSFLQQVVRVLGAVAEQWPDADVRPVLEDLAARPSLGGAVEPAEDAQMELALLTLRDALTVPDSDGVLSGLRRARSLLSSLEAAGDGERIDAQAWATVLDALVAFHHGSTSEVAEATRRLRLELLPLHLSRLNTRPGWRSGRADTEREWLRLTDGLTEAAARLDELAWRDRDLAVSQVLTAYEAERTVRVVNAVERPDQAGLHALLAPRVEAGLIRNRGLLASLDYWLEDEARSADPDQVEAAQNLRNAVVRRRDHPASGDAEGNVSGGLGPRTRILLGDDAIVMVDSPGARALVGLIETRLADREASSSVTGTYAVDQLYRQVRGDLADAVDLHGEVGDHYLTLVLALLRFLAARHDPSQRDESQTKYLFESNPHERRLGEDLSQWLRSGDMPVRVLTEVRDLAGGRVDVYVSWGGHAFVVELKREVRDTSRSAIGGYLPQAVVYQGTDVGLGALLVLDLTTERNWVPGLRDDVWVARVEAPESSRGTPRWALVGVVPGRRTAPHSMRPGHLR